MNENWWEYSQQQEFHVIIGSEYQRFLDSGTIRATDYWWI
jgi:hypothetical protein